MWRIQDQYSQHLNIKHAWELAPWQWVHAKFVSVMLSMSVLGPKMVETKK
jgi:hypothetical protein